MSALRWLGKALLTLVLVAVLLAGAAVLSVLIWMLAAVLL